MGMTRPMLGFVSFCSTAITLAGIELMHMIRKGQLKYHPNSFPCAAILSVRRVNRFAIADPARSFENFATESNGSAAGFPFDRYGGVSLLRR